LLRAISWINKRLFEVRTPTSRLVAFEPFGRAAILGFFAHYPSLRLAQWLNASSILDDPFDTDYLSPNIRAPVICQVVPSQQNSSKRTVLRLSWRGMGDVEFSEETVGE
jgi:hypothetical protein